MSKTSILTILNVLVAVAAGAFIYQVLPYAHGVACDAGVRGVDACPDLSDWELALSAFVPAMVISVFVAGGLKLGRSHAGLSVAALLVPPVLAVAWVAVVVAG
jgi:hypothetical protein